MAAALDEVKSDAENFQQIDFQNKKTIKVNSLFNFIEDLIAENNEVSRTYKIDNIDAEGRCAYIIRFTEKPHLHLFNGFEWVDSHLTVDKYYAKVTSQRGSLGFTAAHYTERYKDNATNQEKIVHVFFNAQGQTCK